MEQRTKSGKTTPRHRLSSKLKALFSSAVFKEVYLQVIIGILATVLATYLLSVFSYWNEVKLQNEHLVYALENMYTSSSKDWIEDQFGSATFQYQDEKYLQRVYVTDLAIVNTFFEKDSDVCIAYFITLRDSDDAGKISVSPAYSHLFGGKKLGSFTYNELSSYTATTVPPEEVSGFFTNGSGRIFYGEYYWLSNHSHRKAVFQGYLDYGCFFITPTQDMDNKSHLTDPEDLELYSTIDENTWVNLNRKNTYPNTYGIITQNASEIFELIQSYDNFDSTQLWFAP